MTICYRYWNDEEHTRQVVHKDLNDPDTVWMHTGDEGILDEDGYLRSMFDLFLYFTQAAGRSYLSISVVGRIKDIIIRGGEVCFFFFCKFRESTNHLPFWLEPLSSTN